VRLHELRHTHASFWLAAGVHPKVVSERLGHSSVAFTLDTYAHVMPGMQSEAAPLFSDLVYAPPAEGAPTPPGSQGSSPYADPQQTEEDDS
jgi:hypothetical protein